MAAKFGLAAMVALVLAAPAFGQPASPAQGAGADAASPAGITKAEITNFAQATVKLHALGQPSPEQMANAITSTGLSVDRYNLIAGRMQSDAAFKQQVDAELIRAQSQMTAQTPATGITPAQAAPPPPLPTAGAGAQLLRVLDKVCIPMVRQDVAVGDVAPDASLKRNRRDGSFRTALGEKPYSVAVFPRGANQAVCNVEIRHRLGEDEDISRALNIWTMHQQPELKMVRNDVAVGADGLKRTTLSWERTSAQRAAALVFVRVQQADGSPLERGVGSATLLYSERPA